MPLSNDVYVYLLVEMNKLGGRIHRIERSVDHVHWKSTKDIVFLKKKKKKSVVMMQDIVPPKPSEIQLTENI